MTSHDTHKNIIQAHSKKKPQKYYKIKYPTPTVRTKDKNKFK